VWEIPSPAKTTQFAVLNSKARPFFSPLSNMQVWHELKENDFCFETYYYSMIMTHDA
jgi:hypothetical protein